MTKETISDNEKGSPVSQREKLQQLQVQIAELEATKQHLQTRITALEEQLTISHETQEHLSALFQALPDLAFVLDRSGRYVEILTGSKQDLLYKSASEMEGQTLSAVLPSRVAEPALACVRRSLETGNIQTLEYWLDVPSGRRWFEGRTAPMHTNAAGTDLVVWISRDITARKDAEEALRKTQQRYALATTAGRVGIWEWNPSTETFYLDPHLQALLGYEEDRVVTDWRNLFETPDIDALVARVEAHLEGRTPAFDYVCQILHQNGLPLWVMIRGSMVHQQKGRPGVLVGTFTDITERWQAEMAREKLLSTLQSRNAQMQTAAEVSRAISSMLDPETLLQEVVDLIREGFNLYYVGIFLVNHSEIAAGEGVPRWAILQAGTGEVAQEMLAKGHKLEIGGPSMIGWSIAHQQARISLDTGGETLRFKNPWLPKTHSELALPLISRGEVIGALSIQSEKASAFSERDITVLQTMADQLANAIVNTRLYEQAQEEIAERREAEARLRQHKRELELLNSANRALAAPLNLDEVLNTILQKVQQLLGVVACSVWLLDRDQLVCKQATGANREVVIDWKLKIGQGLAGWVAETGESVIVNDARHDPRYFDGVAEETGLEIRSILCAPLKIKEDIIGILQVVDRKIDRFDLSELKLIESLAATSAIAVENARLYEQAHQDAATKTALLDEANHRVKNNLTAIMGILALELQQPYDQADDFRALLRDLLRRIQGMATVHSLLSETKWSPIPLKRLTEEIIHAALGGSPISQKIRVRIQAPPEPLLVVPRQATNLAILINELTTNSAKHAFRNQKQGVIDIQISIQEENPKKIILRYHDNGPGWPEKIISGSNTGVGIRLMRLITHGPMLEDFTIENDHGAAATLTFKLIPFS